jgi:hypothetical protein
VVCGTLRIIAIEIDGTEVSVSVGFLQFGRDGVGFLAIGGVPE